MSQRIEIGDVLEGFCDGWFGRDSYDDKTVVHVGADYVVVSENSYWGPDMKGPFPMISVCQTDYRDKEPVNPRDYLVKHLKGEQ